MTQTIKIAKDLSLPVDVVTQVEVIIAKRRAGKSYTMRRMTEELLEKNQQVVLVDPKGDQWGIRSSADGKSPGFPMLILGGEHGDLPLEVNGGELVAKLVVEERVSVLLDLSVFRKHEIATFMTAFLENLYRLKAQEKYRTPVKLVVDEADAIAPQKPQMNETRMLGAIEDIVRRGGQRGIGCTLVTQRSAVLNKNVLTQAQILVVLRTIAPQDLAAIKAWIDVHGSIEEGKELMGSLPSLPVGDAWFWSPGWPTETGIFKRVHVLPIETFDSGATPKPGQRRIVPKNLADVDLKALEKQMAETIEKVKNEDPKHLRKRIVELESQIKNAKPVENKTQLEGAIKVALHKRDLEWEKVVGSWERYAQKLSTLINSTHISLRESYDALALKEPESLPAFTLTPSNLEPAVDILQNGESKLNYANMGVKYSGNGTASQVEVSLKKGARRMLETLVSRYPMKFTRSQWATLSDISSNSGTFSSYLSLLRTAGFIIEEGNLVYASQEGIDYLGGSVPSPVSSEEVQSMWRGKLKQGARRMFDVLITSYPDFIRRIALADAAEIAADGGTFSSYLSSLRVNGLIEERDNGRELRASADLFTD